MLQYTALAWSPRAFPMEVPRVIKALRDAGARIDVVTPRTLREEVRDSAIAEAIPL